MDSELDSAEVVGRWVLCSGGSWFEGGMAADLVPFDRVLKPRFVLLSGLRRGTGVIPRLIIPRVSRFHPL